MNPRLKEMMKELGDAINSSVSESEPIAQIVARFKDEGYDIFLALQATIGFTRRNEEDNDEGEEPVGAFQATLGPQFSVNANDIRFLKALRINVDEAH